MKRSLPNRALHAVFSRVNRKRQWYELPTTRCKALNLLSLRLDLRDMNLFDTGHADPQRTASRSLPRRRCSARRPDGKWNDLKDPEMGSTGTAFTRNIDPKRIKPEKPPRLHDPSPRTVSLELMTRDEFKPAANLNVLAAAWIQFENHNWFFHGRGEPGRGRGGPARRGGRLARAPDARPPHRPGAGATPGRRARTATAADRLRQHRDPLVGRVADLRLEPGDARTRCAPSRTASSRSSANGRLLPDPERARASTWPASTRTGGSGSPACTRCSPRSTTRSATCSSGRTRTGTTSACSTPRGSSTPR